MRFLLQSSESFTQNLCNVCWCSADRIRFLWVRSRMRLLLTTLTSRSFWQHFQKRFAAFRFCWRNSFLVNRSETSVNHLNTILNRKCVCNRHNSPDEMLYTHSQLRLYKIWHQPAWTGLWLYAQLANYCVVPFLNNTRTRQIFIWLRMKIFYSRCGVVVQSVL